MKTEEILGLWCVTNKGICIPLSYDQLCREIARRIPDVIPYKLINQLEADGYIETTSRGERVLTRKGLHDRIPLNMDVNHNSLANDDAAWLKFRRVCNYYIDCVHHSEKTQEYLFLDGLNNKFLLPSMPIGWLLPTHEPIRIGTSSSQEVALNRIKARKDEDEEVYIGYPLSGFKSVRGKTLFSPIFLVPVDITFDIVDIYLMPRYDEISINQSWLEFALKKDEQKACIEGICSCEEETKGLIDMSLAIKFLSNKYGVQLNPNYLEYSLSPQSQGLLNTAALFIGEGLKFSKTLKKELKYISNQPSQLLNHTSLAYVFRDPPLPNKYESESNNIPFDFIPCNSEQHNALYEALNRPASKVTGPPGTGKSQVAVNLIANLVYRDKAVLFTSKNHKAIHAIAEKCEAASRSVPLIQFCSKADGTSGSVWYTQDIDSLIGLYVSARTQVSPRSRISIEKISDAEKDWQDYKADILSHESIRERMALINATLESLEDSILLQENEVSHKTAEQLRGLASSLILEEPKQFWKRILIYFAIRRSRSAEKQLRFILPDLAAGARSREALQVRVNRLCGKITNYIQLIEEREGVLKSNEKNPYPPVLERLTRIKSTIQEHLQDAFVLKRADSVCSIEAGVKQNLINAMSLLRRRNLPFLQQVIDIGTLNDAQNAFVQYSKFFPAWASTLLSLTKASPCIPALFDRVIIDEASQCEIPPMIPALFRSKGVTVIGDPNQFPPVITMRENRHAYLRYTKHQLRDMVDERYDFINHSAYDMLMNTPILLREHFRCNEDIADYFNDTYYQSKLKVRTNAESLKFPLNMGYQRGIVWYDISTCVADEIKTVENIFEDLIHNAYRGTVGVISPFREVANKLAACLTRYQGRFPSFDVNTDVNTANGFQGGERDLIIFVLAITDELTKGQEWYAISEENRYIYNVAASRARACLIVVGNREKALNSESGALRKLAQPLRPAREIFQSPWEKVLYDELVKNGYKPVAQHPLAGRYLDLALVEHAIDIEVDGQAWHLNKYGERKQDDIYRDLTITSCGWQVKRFWVHELRDDMEKCLKEIAEAVKNRNQSHECMKTTAPKSYFKDGFSCKQGSSEVHR